MKNLITHTVIICILCMLSAYNNSAIAATTIVENDSTIIIAQANSDNLYFVSDITMLQRDLQNFLNMVPVSKDRYVVNNIGLVEENHLYYLIATGERGKQKFRAAMLLTQSPLGCLYVSGLTTLCYTIDCENDANACMPTDDYCSHCPNTCTRTSSSTPIVFFPSLPIGECGK